MPTMKREIMRLRAQIEHAQNRPQSVANEVELAYLRLELLEREGRRNIELARTTRTLIEAYRETGSMRIRLPERLLSAVPTDTAATMATARWIEGHPFDRPGLGEVQRWWNVLREAERLADMAVP